MGAGKSTIGRQVAKRLDRPFYDCDKEIEARTGVDISTIFDYESEAGFRDRETAMLDELTRKEGIVLATGGGAILRPENRRMLHERGLVIYLSAAVETQVERTRHDQGRPLLHGTDPHLKLNELMAIRDPLYREAAHVTLKTDGQSVKAVARRIAQLLQNEDSAPH
jgi:shikimate kinase